MSTVDDYRNIQSNDVVSDTVKGGTGDDQKGKGPENPVRASATFDVDARDYHGIQNAATEPLFEKYFTEHVMQPPSRCVDPKTRLHNSSDLHTCGPGDDEVTLLEDEDALPGDESQNPIAECSPLAGSAQYNNSVNVDDELSLVNVDNELPMVDDDKNSTNPACNSTLSFKDTA